MNPKPLRMLAALAVAAFAATACAAPDTLIRPAARLSSCIAPASWAAPASPAPRPTTLAAVIDAMAERDVVLLGEQHNRDDDHRWQLHLLAALHAKRPQMVIGLEMFPRRVQPALDRWVAGELTLADFLRESDWDEVWRLPAELYRPIFEFARINRIPMVALNVDPGLIRAIAARGWDAVAAAEREGVGRPAPPAAAYVDFLSGIHREHVRMRGEATSGQRTDAGFRRFVESQTTWDRAMAEALASRAAADDGAGGRALVVGIMGSGHVRHGLGVAHQLRDLGIDRIGSLLPLPATTDCASLDPGVADAVFALPPQAAEAAPPPRLGVQLEEQAAGVRIAEVMAGSLASRSGLQEGDLIVETAGQASKRSAQLIAAIRGQPAGTWLPLKVKRGEALLEIVVRFPAAGS
jgi:uncharacterized iron-regulated protein